MNTSRRITSIALACSTAISLSACAGPNYRPIVDMQGVNGAAYEADLKDCQSYATQTAGAADSAAAGAVAGALLGALLGAAAGGNGRFNSHMAQVGAVSGAVGAGAQGETNQRDIVRRCMAGRGYRVLQ
jgi:uncharacterized protein YcfJ